MKQKIAEIETRELDLGEREAAFNQREAEFNMRYQQLAEGEEILRENQRRMAVATENLKAQWAMLRQERDRIAAAESAIDEMPREEEETDFGPSVPQRPPLEERK